MVRCLGGWENSLWEHEDLGWIPSNPVTGCTFVTTCACPPSVRGCVWDSWSSLLSQPCSNGGFQVEWEIPVSSEYGEEWRRSIHYTQHASPASAHIFTHLCGHNTHSHSRTSKQTTHTHTYKRCWKWPRWVKSFTRLICSNQHAVSSRFVRL